MADTHGNEVAELAVNSCSDLLRDAGVGRLAVRVEDHLDILPISFVVDHGTLVLRSAEGTKMAGALTVVPVAVEIDGDDEASGRAWSVVVKGRAERIQQNQELTDTLDMPLLPWQSERKGVLVRVVPGPVTGRGPGGVPHPADGGATLPRRVTPRSPPLPEGGRADGCGH